MARFLPPRSNHQQTTHNLRVGTQSAPSSGFSCIQTTRASTTHRYPLTLWRVVPSRYSGSCRRDAICARSSRMTVRRCSRATTSCTSAQTARAGVLHYEKVVRIDPESEALAYLCIFERINRLQRLEAGHQWRTWNHSVGDTLELVISLNPTAGVKTGLGEEGKAGRPRFSPRTFSRARTGKSCVVRTSSSERSENLKSWGIGKP